MRDIEDAIGMFMRARDELKAPRPARLRDAGRDILRRDREAVLIQLLGGGDRQRHIAQLMASDQRRLDEDRLVHHLEKITAAEKRAGLVRDRPQGIELYRARRD